jgi:hypothetical protein
LGSNPETRTKTQATGSFGALPRTIKGRVPKFRELPAPGHRPMRLNRPSHPNLHPDFKTTQNAYPPIFGVDR